MGAHTMRIFLNPLIFPELEFRSPGIRPEDTSHASVVNFLCCPDTNAHVPALIARYNEISVEQNRLPAAPSEDNLLARLIWPLRHAKGSYVVGNYLGTIALCGLVAEMAAILTFDLYNEAQDSPRYDRDKQIKLFGRTFEKLGQERRVDVLESLGLITSETANAFNTIRERRRGYLHLWSAGHNRLAEDAVQCFDASINIVVATLGLSFREGKLQFKDDVFTYLNKHGITTPWVPPAEFLSTADEVDATDETDPES